MHLNDLSSAPNGLHPIPEEVNEQDIEIAVKPNNFRTYKQKVEDDDFKHFLRSKLFIITVLVATLGICILCVGFLMNYERKNDITLTVDAWKDKLSDEQYFWYKEGLDELKVAFGVNVNNHRAKNVILFVGNGMGPATMAAARLYAHGEAGSLSWENFPHMGLLKTYSADKQVADSSSAATALIGGVKSNFQTIGVDSHVQLGSCNDTFNDLRHVDSIIEWAQEADLATGFVTNGRIVHGVAAALYSHAADHRWECDAKMPPNVRALGCKDIARQLFENAPGRNINVIMGGGRQCLQSGAVEMPSDPLDELACQSADGRNLIDDWKFDKTRRFKKHRVVETAGDLEKLTGADVDYVLGVFGNSHLNYEDRRPAGQPSLTEMTEAALKVLLRDDRGFVLVVESGLIQHAHERGFARRALAETVELDKAIAATVEVMRPYLDETLLIVTSTHANTLSINGYPEYGADILGFAGNSSPDGIPYTTLTYATSNLGYQVETSEADKCHRRNPSTDNTSAFEYVQQAAIKTDQSTNSGVDVGIFAMGPMAHLFHRVHEQSYVAHVISYAARIGRFRDTATANALLDILGFN